MATENAEELETNTEEQEEVVQELPNPLEMSDEEYEKLDPSVFQTTPEPSSEAVNAEASTAKEDDEEEVAAEATAEAGSSDDSDDAAVAEADAASSDTKNDTTFTDDAGTKDAGKEEVKKAVEKDTVQDYEADVKKILSPFKANGKEIQVDSIDDAISLMSMGANYNKKMAALKPSLKIMKMLDNNGLLDEAKINNLIDLDKKNPGAIQKLIKDSGMDPLEIDTTKESEYTPSTYNVADTEVELDNVLTELEGSKTFQTTLDIIGNKLDASSKKVLAESPGIIRVINEHVERGIYEQVQAGVDKERMLGRLEGLNDIQAYKLVGDMMNEQGVFNTPTAQTEDTANPTDTKVEDKATELARKTRKKAASPTKSSTAGKTPANAINPLAMSDEEFEKQSAQKYM